MKTPDTVAAYYAAVPPQAKKHLAALRALVKKAAPTATEKLAYGIPTFVLGKNLVHLGGYERHVALYGGRAMAGDGALAKYQSGKGTLRFELDEPLPLGLLRRFLAARVRELLEQTAPKRSPRRKGSRDPSR